MHLQLALYKVRTSGYMSIDHCQAERERRISHIQRHVLSEPLRGHDARYISDTRQLDSSCNIAVQILAVRYAR
jgi:hypothetical protein